MTKRVGVDIDGVLCDTVAQFLPVIKRENPVVVEAVLSKGLSALVSEGTKSDLLFNPVYYGRARPYEGAQRFLQDLKIAGCSIYLVTARPSSLELFTEKWLFKNKMPFDRLVHARDKAVVAEYANLDFFLEDMIENAEALSKVCMSYLLDRPWNQGKGGFTRVNSYDEVLDLEGLR